MYYLKLPEPLGESFYLKSNKRRKNDLIDDVSLLTNPSQYFREKYQDYNYKCRHSAYVSWEFDVLIQQNQVECPTKPTTFTLREHF